MKRALLCLALLGLGNCTFAVKHQAVTIGIVAGTIGFGTCELNTSEHKTCGLIGAGAALALGGITALVTLLANTNAQEPDPYLQNEDGRKYESVTAPPPGLPPAMMVDAGVAVQAPADAAPVGDASLGDANP